jgi:hypothetical protein
MLDFWGAFIECARRRAVGLVGMVWGLCHVGSHGAQRGPHWSPLGKGRSFDRRLRRRPAGRGTTTTSLGCPPGLRRRRRRRRPSYNGRQEILMG